MMEFPLTLPDVNVTSSTPPLFTPIPPQLSQYGSTAANNSASQIGITVAAILLIAGLTLIGYTLLKKYQSRRQTFTVPTVAEPATAQSSLKNDVTVKKLEKQIERLNLTLAKSKEAEFERDIIKDASKRIEQIVPDKFAMLDPSSQIRGRPIYSIGGIPVIDKELEIQNMVDANRLGVYMPELLAKLYNWIHFGTCDTLYFWAAELLPIDGKWRIIATSKPPRRTRRYVKRAWGAREYLIEPSEQESIDDMFTNRWEAVKGKAALILSCTFAGPVPLDAYMKTQQQKGWINNVERNY